MKRFATLFAGLALVCFLTTGCGPDAPKDTNTKTNTNDTAKKKDDGHAHAHGPNHGHIFEFEPHEFHGEWKQYTDNNVIKIFILDEAGKKNVAVKADSVSIIPKTGSDKTPFVLVADSPNEAGEAEMFMIDDEALRRGINLGVDVVLKVGDKTYKGEIAAHEAMDH